MSTFATVRQLKHIDRLLLNSFKTELSKIVRKAISELPFASVSKRVQVRSLSYGN